MDIQKKDCTRNGKTYEHGSVLNEEGLDLLCDNGDWTKEMREPPGPELVIAPGKDLSEM